MQLYVMISFIIADQIKQMRIDACHTATYVRRRGGKRGLIDIELHMRYWGCIVSLPEFLGLCGPTRLPCLNS